MSCDECVVTRCISSHQLSYNVSRTDFNYSKETKVHTKKQFQRGHLLHKIPDVSGSTPSIPSYSAKEKIKRHLSLTRVLFSSLSLILKMKRTLVTILCFVVALASAALAETPPEAISQCVNTPINGCLEHDDCVINNYGKHITCISTTHS